MHDANEMHNDDILEQSTRTLRETPVPPEPEPEILNDILATLNEVPGGSSIVLRVRTMSRATRIAAALVIVVGLSGLVTWLIPNRPGSGIAFAQVLEHFQSAPAFAATTKIESEEDGESPADQRIYCRGSRIRLETPGMIAQVMATDLGQVLTLDMTDNTASVTDYSEEEGTLPPARPDLIVKLSTLKAGSEERVGGKIIDGRRTTGFRITSEGAGWTIWADVTTGRPVRVEMKNEQLAKETVVVEDFIFDADLDESLFSLTPPVGYVVVEQSFQISTTQGSHSSSVSGGLSFGASIGTTLPANSDDDSNARGSGLSFSGSGSIHASIGTAYSEDFEGNLLEALCIWADHDHGKFPPEISPRTRKTLLERIRKSEADGKSVTGRNGKQTAVINSFTEARRLQRQDRFHYTGDGAKLGDLDRPICRWKPEGAEIWRVIYGDLSVRDLGTEDVKK
jgi:outer membrane lipoprotein-sorting protein